MCGELKLPFRFQKTYISYVNHRIFGSTKYEFYFVFEPVVKKKKLKVVFLEQFLKNRGFIYEFKNKWTLYLDKPNFVALS